MGNSSSTVTQLANALIHNPLCMGMTQEQLHDWCRLVSMQTYPQGATIYAANSAIMESSYCYVVLSGQVQLAPSAQALHVPAAEWASTGTSPTMLVKEGELFGEVEVCCLTGITDISHNPPVTSDVAVAATPLLANENNTSDRSETKQASRASQTLTSSTETDPLSRLYLPTRLCTATAVVDTVCVLISANTILKFTELYPQLHMSLASTLLARHPVTLASIPLFSLLPQALLPLLSQFLRLRSLHGPKTYLYREGETNNADSSTTSTGTSELDLFVVARGSVVMLGQNPRLKLTEPIKVLTEGDVVGEVEAICGIPRVCAVVNGSTDSLLYVVSKPVQDYLMAGLPAPPVPATDNAGATISSDSSGGDLSKSMSHNTHSSSSSSSPSTSFPPIDHAFIDYLRTWDDRIFRCFSISLASALRMRCSFVSRFGTVRRFTEKTTLTTQGEPGDVFYIVLHGQLSVSVGSGNAKANSHTSKLGRGDYFGELSLLYGCPRTATVETETHPCVLLELSRNRFNQLVGGALELCAEFALKTVPAESLDLRLVSLHPLGHDCFARYLRSVFSEENSSFLELAKVFRSIFAHPLNQRDADNISFTRAPQTPRHHNFPYPLFEHWKLKPVPALSSSSATATSVTHTSATSEASSPDSLLRLIYTPPDITTTITNGPPLLSTQDAPLPSPSAPAQSPASPSPSQQQQQPHAHLRATTAPAAMAELILTVSPPDDTHSGGSARVASHAKSSTAIEMTVPSAATSIRLTVAGMERDAKTFQSPAAYWCESRGRLRCAPVSGSATEDDATFLRLEEKERVVFVAKQIIGRFIRVQATEQLNLSALHRHDVEESLRDPLHADSFAPAEQAVLKLLAQQTLSDFFKSKISNEFKEAVRLYPDHAILPRLAGEV